MPVPINNSRPSLPYAPTQSLPNNTRFGILTTTQRPPTAEMLDAEFNALTDDVNMLAAAINGVQAGSIPGANDPLNANKVLKTDGANNLSWTQVTNAEIEVNAVVEQKLAAQAVTTPKIGDAAVTTQKIAQNAVGTNQIIDANVTTVKLADANVTTTKIADAAITTAKIANQAVTQGQIANAAVGTPQLIDGNVTTAKIGDANITTAKIADAAVTTPKLAVNAVTAAKIGSEASLANTFLAADGAGNASFIDKIGRILQIVSYENAKYVLNEYNAAATPQTPLSFQSGAFALNITPKKTGSKILLYYSINVGGYRIQYNSVVLCKNDAVFKKGDDSGATYIGLTHCYYGNQGGGAGYGSNEFGASIYSNLFVDTGTQGVQIVYEIKKAHPYTVLNGGYSQSFPSISTMVAVEIDI